jgi:hypothetical protein
MEGRIRDEAINEDTQKNSKPAGSYEHKVKKTKINK